MMHDPIVEEIHRFREKFAAKYGYNPHRIGAALRRREKKRLSGQQVKKGSSITGKAETSCGPSAMHDPILEELWAVKDKIAAKYDYDVRKLGEALREEVKQSGRPTVTLPPRRTKSPKRSRPKKS